VRVAKTSVLHLALTGRGWRFLGWILVPLIVLAQDQTGTVSGVVTDAVTHQPVKKATVQIAGGGFAGKPDRHVAVTDATGAYTLASVAPGRHMVSVSHPTYPEGNFKQIDVKPGENTSYSPPLTPGASITGRVLDEDGDPVQGCIVTLRFAQHADQGVPIQGSVQPGIEDGEYRIFGIAPGKYIVSANCGGAVFQPRPFSAGPDPPPSVAYPVQFYPLTPDAKSAQAVQLFPGMEKTGVDFRMKPAPVTQIHGKFSPAGADWHGKAQMTVQLISADRNSRMNGVGAQIDPSKGTFEFHRVFPGSYTVIAGSNDQSPIGAEQHVDVKDRPLDLVIELRPAIDLGGTMEVEGNPTNGFALNQVTIQLTPEGRQMQSPRQVQAKNDGTFTIQGIVPGHWRLQVFSPLAFVKSARLGAQEVTDGLLDLSAGAPGPLHIVMSTNMGTIQGTAPPGYTVMAQEIRGDQALGARGAEADASGRFSIPNLAPGKYRLTATIPNPRTLLPIPEEGQEITLHEGETANVDVKPPSNP